MKAVFGCLTALAIVSLLAAAPHVAFADCPEGSFDTGAASMAHSSWGTVNDINKKVFVSTRNGFQNGGFKVVVRNSSNQPVPGVEVWIARDDQSANVYREQLGCMETVCTGDGYPECPEVINGIYVYVEGVTDSTGTVIFSQRWGGSDAGGQGLIIQVPTTPCTELRPNLSKTAAFETSTFPFKSTDMNGDGKWNECDRSMFAAAITQGDTVQADFDLDGDVDSADRAIIEADFEDACGVNLTTCYEDASGQSPACGTSILYPSTVCDLEIDYVGQTEVGLMWTAPGANGNSGTASFYTLRRSLSPITTANFNSATLISSPTPGSPGSPQSQSVTGLQSCTTYYFAIKATNGSKGTGWISNVAVVQTSCSKTTDVRGAPEVLDLSIADGHAVRGEARISYAVPSGDAGNDGSLAVFDAAGRRIRSLVAGSIEPGTHEVFWDLRSDDGARIGAGVYFARLRIGDKELSRTLVVLAE